MGKQFTYLLNIFLVFSNNIIYSQSIIEIINADEISFNKKLNKNRQVLNGNVKAKHENRLLTCDSAYYYINENIIEAFSNINIWEEENVSLKGDYLIYEGNKKLAEIHKNVLLSHKKTKIQSKKLQYNFGIKKAYYKESAKIIQEEKSISSVKGIYFTIGEKFEFYNNVIFINHQDTLMADTIFYESKPDIATFYSNGIIKNKKIQVLANQGWLNQKKGEAKLNGEIQINYIKKGAKLFSEQCIISDKMTNSKAFENTLLFLYNKQDTLYLSADTLYYFESKHLFKALQDVSFKSNKIIGKCDSLNYYKEKKEVSMYFSPTIWVDEFQFTSKNINIIHDEDQNINKTELIENAFIISQIDSIRFNQIKGENMFVKFVDNKLTNIDVNGNGESIYYIEEVDRGRSKGLNKVVCSNMKINITFNQIKQITFYENADAIIKPIEQVVPSEILLKNFIWHKKNKTFNKINKKINYYFN